MNHVYMWESRMAQNEFKKEVNNQYRLQVEAKPCEPAFNKYTIGSTPKVNAAERGIPKVKLRGE